MDPEKSARFSDIIVKPWVSEKAQELKKQSKYGFIVSKRANKGIIKEMVSGMYGVRPVNIHIISRGIKEQGVGRFHSRRQAHKIAIVTLREGEKIEIAQR